MTMDLILWRHAEAEEGSNLIADEERRLTARGDNQAKQMAAWLRRYLPRRCRILASPAARTRQTAEALKRPYEIEPKVGVGATAADVLAVAGWPEQGDTVLVVGHQPTLGCVASLLLAGKEADWTVKKGGVWWFSGRLRDGATQTVLRAVMNPELA
jgi:phosphohistidine phosphatase